MRLLVTGGTGFIGTPLCRALVRRGHELLVLTRQASRSPTPGTRFLAWEDTEWQRAIQGVEGVINLTGESIAAKRWSPRQKSLIRESRLQTTRRLVDAMAAASHRPAVLVNASAVGFYGAHGDEELAESDPPGRGFHAELCQAWEAEAQRAEALGIRVVCFRIGLVLGPDGGALQKMVPPFRFFLGGPLGSGRQWVSWIHRNDLIGLIEWTLASSTVFGSINATAPQPVTMRALSRELGVVLHRPSWAPVPAPILRLLLGEMADLLLTGQRVLPTVALRNGYRFAHPSLNDALVSCLDSR